MIKLEFKDVKQLIERVTDEIYTIPDDFEIHEDYLADMSKDRFIKAFKDYRNIIANYYKKASQNMIEYGYSNINRKTGEEVLQKPFESSLMPDISQSQVIFFILRLIKSAKFNNNTLIINTQKFYQELNRNGKIHKPDKIIANLIKEGFEFDGYNKFIKNSESISVSYPPNPDVIFVMIQYAQNINSEISSMMAGVIFDYARFNYKLLCKSKERSLELTDLFLYYKLNDISKQFLVEFNKFMNENAYVYRILCWFGGQFVYSKDPNKNKNYVCRLLLRNENIIVRLYLSNIDTFSEYISNAPDFIKDTFVGDSGKCLKCKGEKCKYKKIYTINGVEYSKCNGEFFFCNVNLNAIPYYIDLINLSKSKGKCNTIIKY